MKVSVLCKYPVIHEGVKSILKEKYPSITSFYSIDECFKAMDNDNNTNDDEQKIVIVTLFKEDLKSLDQLLSIKEVYNNVKLLIIDFNDNKDMFFKLSKLNIDGYMLSSFGKEDINYALHKISTGTKFYDRELLYRLVEAEPAATLTAKNNIGAPLTRRELEILSQLSNGLSNFEISKNLNISENTVKKHISNIFIKINVKDRTQAIIYAYESGLITKPLFL